MRMTDEQIRRAREASTRARAVLRPGDRVSAVRCLETPYHFLFDHWEGDWICGRTYHVTDCHALHIRRVNGARVDFTADA